MLRVLTLVVCPASRSWDGEEYGLLGSVEFVEKHAHILNAQAVAYINVDFGVKGTTKLQAKGTLAPLLCP
jgi:N-acetylated-alpha-linked acidic dipeptidase